jgi:hypothetical protein
MKLVFKILFLLLAICFLGIPLHSAQGEVAPVLALQKSFSVDISHLLSIYETLSADEKDEQIRDWAMYGLLESIDIRGYVSSGSNGGVPIRSKDSGKVSENRLSPGRVAILNGKEGLVLVPREAVSDTLLIGTLVDQEKAEFKTIPTHVYILSYSLGVDSRSIQIEYDRTVAGKDFFSAAYGYYEQEIRTLNDFSAFVDAVDDVTSVNWKDKKLVLGGRRKKEHTASGLSVDALAALYQAYNKPVDPKGDAARRRAYEAFIGRKYDETVKKDSSLRKALASGKISRRSVLNEIRKKIPYTPLDTADAAVGFSLDPERNFPGLGRDLTRLINKDQQWVPSADIALSQIIDSQTVVLNNLVVSLRDKHDIVPLLRVVNKFKKSDSYAGKKYAQILQTIEIKNSYQTARYDGSLQGTVPGMILFYTDLTAKLWALDYNHLAPQGKIKGFLTIPEIKVPRLYWNDFIALSQTRLWFGLRQESFDIQGNELRFAPIATRVYAASSDPLKPGKESKPNYQSAAFLGWWDLHFAAVADYEPYYYKLNQLQKWGCIFMVLKEVKSPALDFLGGVPVVHDRDFVQWYGNATDLKSKAELPFKDRNIYHKNTECMMLLGSRDYPLMGQSFFLSGGVSLASRKDILSKLKMRERASPERPSVNPKKVPTITQGRKTTPRSTVQASAADSPASRPERAPVSVRHGTMVVSKLEHSVTLIWNKGAGDIVKEYVDTLVRAQDNKQPGYKSESILSSVSTVETVVRLDAGKAYLVKCKGIGNNWISIHINEPEKTSDDCIQSSGTNPDSDIISARLIANLTADKIISKNNGSTIFSVSATP